MSAVQFDEHDERIVRKLLHIMADIAFQKGGRVGIGTAAQFVVETALTRPEIETMIMSHLDDAKIGPANDPARHGKKPRRRRPPNGNNT